MGGAPIHSRLAESIAGIPTKVVMPKQLKQMTGLTEKGPALEFRTWLNLFFIEHESFVVTDKAVEAFYPERTTGLSKKEIKSTVRTSVEQKIAAGEAEQLYDKGYVIPIFDWRSHEARFTVTRKFLSMFGIAPEKVRKETFELNGMKGLLRRLGNSPYTVLVQAGYAYSTEETLEHADKGKWTSEASNDGSTRSPTNQLAGQKKIYFWQMDYVPRLYSHQNLRVAATKWLLWKVGKEKKPEELTTEDFRSNGLTGLIDYYKNSQYAALVDAGYAYSVEETLAHARDGDFNKERLYPWELHVSPQGFYKLSENRAAATKWLIWRTEKQPKDIQFEDFYANGLDGVTAYYNSSPYLALVDAGYAYSVGETKQHSNAGEYQTAKIYPWEMRVTPHGFYDEKANMRTAVRWLAWKTDKTPSEIVADDFENNGMVGLLQTYNRSPFEVLFAAGLVGRKQEAFMRSNRSTTKPRRRQDRQQISRAAS